MATIEESLYARLAGDTAVAAILSDRVYPAHIPDHELTLPWAMYAVSSSEPVKALGAATLVRHQVDIELLAETYAGVRQLADAVRTSLDTYRGGQIQLAHWAGDAVQLEDEGYRCTQTYRVYGYDAPVVAVPSGGLPRLQVLADGVYFDGVRLLTEAVVPPLAANYIVHTAQDPALPNSRRLLQSVGIGISVGTTAVSVANTDRGTVAVGNHTNPVVSPDPHPQYLHGDGTRGTTGPLLVGSETFAVDGEVWLWSGALNQPIALQAGDGVVTVAGAGVQADYFAGDGSQLTNLPPGPLPTADAFFRVSADYLGSPQSTSNYEWKRITFTAVNDDPRSGWSAANNWYTVPAGQGGRWLFTLKWRVQDTMPAGQNYLVGVGLEEGDYPGGVWDTSGGTRQTAHMTQLLTLSAGQQVRAFFGWFGGTPHNWVRAELCGFRIAV